jgi:hypothetical protein
MPSAATGEPPTWFEGNAQANAAHLAAASSNRSELPRYFSSFAKLPSRGSSAGFSRLCAIP